MLPGQHLFSGAIVNKPYTGTIVITYHLPPQDVTPLILSPAVPIAIISRKGVNITTQVNLVTAQDNPGESGLSEASVTNNATAIGFNLTNPQPDAYTLTYSVTDNKNNTATVNRQIEITDADPLQTLLNTVTTAVARVNNQANPSVSDVRQAAQLLNDPIAAAIAAQSSTPTVRLTQ